MVHCKLQFPLSGKIWRRTTQVLRGKLYNKLRLSCALLSITKLYRFCLIRCNLSKITETIYWFLTKFEKKSKGMSYKISNICLLYYFFLFMPKHTVVGLWPAGVKFPAFSAFSLSAVHSFEIKIIFHIMSCFWENN